MVKRALRCVAFECDHFAVKNKLCETKDKYTVGIYQCADGCCLLNEWLEDCVSDCTDDEDESLSYEKCAE